MRLRPLVCAVFGLAALAACSRRDNSSVRVSFDSAKAAESAAEPLGPGDVRVVSTDGNFILALVGDSVRMQLSDSLRSKVREEIDSSAGGGVGGMIARTVSGAVSSAMGFVVRIPVTEIDDIRYEDGKIKFGTLGKAKISMGGGEGRDRQSHAEFTRADGERFVAAVKARQAQLGAR
jgi:hypothetical protein